MHALGKKPSARCHVLPTSYIRSMSEIRKANVEGATYFVTFTVVG